MEWTTVLAVDRKTVQQLDQVWPTWCRRKPQLFEQPLLIICDWSHGAEDWWMHRLAFAKHPNRRLVGWTWPDGDHYEGMSQRERMLTAFVKVPPLVVETSSWCKIDTDSVATNDKPWPLIEWWDDDPVLIARPWSYTKPPELPAILDEWAAGIDELADRPPMNCPPVMPGQETMAHREQGGRIASWICFVDTVFSQEILDMVPGRLPVPSQDTLHWYCAWRMGRTIKKIKWEDFGWKNRTTKRGREELVRQVMTANRFTEGCCG